LNIDSGLQNSSNLKFNFKI